MQDTTNTKAEYRGYFFGNMYLSPIQQGIQAAHVIQDMYTRTYQPLLVRSYNGPKIFMDWMNIDRTMILLNGGYQTSLESLYEKFKQITKNGKLYPIGAFREEQEALNGCMTSVGIILPKKVYDYENSAITYDEKDSNIYYLINRFKLA